MSEVPLGRLFLMSEVPLYPELRPPGMIAPCECEDRVRDGPASGEKGSKGELYIGENLSK